MIVREDECGETAAWILIHQRDHAVLAAALARHWGGDFPPIEPPWVVEAIARHDDGWVEWDADPRRGPDGRPVDFTEMPIESAVEIWRASIEQLADLGPLAQWMTARHFVDLRRGGERSDCPASQGFVAEYEARIAIWRTACLADGIDPPVAERAVGQLPLFDRLSLWLCLRRQPTAITITTPDDQTIQLTCPEPGEIRLSPWPFACDELELAAPAWRSRNVDGRLDQSPIELRWKFQRK